MRYNLQWFAEKTETATSRQRDKVRGDGRVAKSADLTSAFSFITLLIGLLWFGNSLFGALWDLTVYMFDSGVKYGADHVGLPQAFPLLIEHIVQPLALIMGLTIIVSLLIAYRQVGRMFTLAPLIPDLGKINPVAGFQRLFSANSFFQLGKSTIQLIFIAAALYLAVSSQGMQVVGLMGASPEQIFAFYAHSAFTILMYVAAMFLLLSIGDFAFQKFTFEKSIRMSKDDIKDERKQSDGDPAIKREIRKRGYAMAFRRMMKKVPQADVIVTNPTHYAVALKYDAKTMHAPQVVAKGTDEVAKRIRELASEHRVPIVEDKPLARALYSQVEIDQFVPNHLFQAVAEVLAYVYRLRQQAR